MSSLLVRSRLRWDSIPKPGEYQLDRWFHHPTVCRKQTKKSLSLKEFFLCPSLLLKLFKYKKNYNKTQKLKDTFLFYFFNFDDYWFDGCLFVKCPMGCGWFNKFSYFLLWTHQSLSHTGIQLYLAPHSHCSLPLLNSTMFLSWDYIYASFRHIVT